MRTPPTFRLPWLDGPPLALPRPVDDVAERWWAARPRTRVTVVVATTLAVVVAGLAQVAGSPHGPPVTVLVATEELRPGDALQPTAVRRESWPAELVPDGVLADPGGTVAALVPVGAVVTERHLGDAGLAAGVPPDRVAATVPHELLPGLTAGTRVDVIGAAHDGSVRTLAEDAVVVGADETDLWLAVDPDAGPAVSAAAARGAVAVVIRPS